MTDRIRSITVALDHDIREDDVQALILAISQLRGVAAVTAGPVVSPNDWATEQRVRNQLLIQIGEVVAGKRDA